MNSGLFLFYRIKKNYITVKQTSNICPYFIVETAITLKFSV